VWGDKNNAQNTTIHAKKTRTEKADNPRKGLL
jgi:hypothetical protein